MTSTLVISDDSGAVRLLTMNRPAARNALSPDLIGALYTELRKADDDPSVRAVVLTGTDPAFCAGVDLKEAQRLGPSYFELFQTQNCIRQTGEMRTPIVGAINGAVFTGGLEMALGCDFLIASERAVFADTHARVGIRPPGGGMTARLPHVVGAAMARRLSMERRQSLALGRRARRANRLGHRGCKHTRAVELAGQIAEVPAPIMAGLKQIHGTGAAAIIDPALAAEQAIAGAQTLDRDGLKDRYAEISERNRRQIRSQPDASSGL